MLQYWLDLGASAFALLAAAFWFSSAYGKLPPMLTYWDSVPENDPFYKAVKFSAQLNRWAAGFSGLSAMCFSIEFYIK